MPLPFGSLGQKGRRWGRIRQGRPLRNDGHYHPAMLPELDALDSTRDLIRIPDEQNVPLTPRVRQLIDTSAFQRLRRISQLGLVAQVYPGATHSRFEHALGVYHNALRYLQQLVRDDRFRQIASTKDAETLVAAALLHDIGHWPYCHPIEDLGLPGLTRHEEAARQLVLGEEVGGVLSDAWGLDPQAVVDVLESRVNTPAGRLVKSILSGPIDIDKMDYLERDSRHAGVPYGRNFDKQRLIQSLTLDADGTGLAITAKGRTAAELMVFARYVMFSEVYWHHAVRSATAMLTRAFLELRHRLPLDRLLEMGDADLESHLQAAADGASPELQALVHGSVGPGRGLYKRVVEFSREDHESLYDRLAGCTADQLAEIGNRLGGSSGDGSSGDGSSGDGSSGDGSSGDGSGGESRPMQMLLDVPSPRRDIEFDITVRQLKHAQADRPLRAVSPVVDALAGSQFTDAVKRVRLFAAPDRAAADRRESPQTWIDRIDAAVEKTIGCSTAKA